MLSNARQLGEFLHFIKRFSEIGKFVEFPEKQATY